MILKQWFVGAFSCLLLGCLQPPERRWRWQEKKKKKVSCQLGCRERKKREWGGCGARRQKGEKKNRRDGVRHRGACETGKIRALHCQGGPWAKQRKKVNTSGTNKSAGTKRRERKKHTTHTQWGREKGRKAEGVIEVGLNWPLSPQARQLHNGASLETKVMLQTGPTGDPNVCVWASVSYKKKRKWLS